MIMRSSAISALMIGMAACATAPRAETARPGLEARADAALGSMKSRDPGLPGLLDASYAYVVFPAIKKSHMDLGADHPGGELGSISAHGRGVLFEQGRMSGYIELNQDSVGGQLDGQTYSELVVFHDRDSVDRLKAAPLELGLDAAAIPVASGHAAAVAESLTGGFAVFTMNNGNLVAELPVTGQKLQYQPVRS
jgi:hypothetical protein